MYSGYDCDGWNEQLYHLSKFEILFLHWIMEVFS